MGLETSLGVGPRPGTQANAGEPTPPGAWGPDPRCPPLNAAVPARPLHTATSPQGIQTAALLSAAHENAAGCPSQPRETSGPPHGEEELDDTGTGPRRRGAAGHTAVPCNPLQNPAKRTLSSLYRHREVK